MLEYAEPAIFIPLIIVTWSVWIIVKRKERRANR